MIKPIFVLTGLLIVGAMFAQDKSNQSSINDGTLLTEYIQSKGAGIIVFDPSNIKQFWVDKSVASIKDSFEILLNEKQAQDYESVPLKIQLANVNEAQDCKIEVIAETEDYGFSVMNDKKKVRSVSSQEDNFIHYSIASSVFHLEDSSDSSFFLVFNSRNNTCISVKKIILSFSTNKNSSYLESPGILKISKDTVTTDPAVATEISSTSFSVTGKQSKTESLKKILVTNGPVSSSVSIKNTGDKDTRIYIGYAVYAKDRTRLDGRNYPYNNNSQVLSVISISEDNKTIITDSYSDWRKNCYLALNAKEDMSDIPNTSFGGRIVEIEKLDNGEGKIVLEKPLAAPLKKGDTVRVHGTGGAYLYTSTQLLHPGEEKDFSSTLQRDDGFLEFSPKALSRGVYSIVPLILSQSVDSKEENTILINNFSISY